MAEIIQATASYPNLVEPTVNRDFPNSPPKYSLTLLMDPNSQGFKDFIAEAQKLAVDKWKEHAGNILQLINTQRNLRCYGRGEESLTKTGAMRNGYAGKIYLNANSDKDHPPVILRRDENGVLKPVPEYERAEAAKRIYGGCKVNAVITPWLQDNAAGKAIRANLLYVEMAGDGEPLGDSTVAVDFGTLFGGPQAPVAPAPNAATPGGLPAFGGMPSFLS